MLHRCLQDIIKSSLWKAHWASIRGFCGTNTLANPSVKLRPYQEECIQTCLTAIRQGRLRLGVSLPTASGKTTIFSSLIGRLPKRRHGDGTFGEKSLILVGTIELARQAAERIQMMNPKETLVEIEQGSQNVASGSADVTVATYQTLVSRDNLRLQKFRPNDFKCVIIDEAHHSAAKSWLTILNHFDPSINIAPKELEVEDDAMEDEVMPGDAQVPKTENKAASMPIIGFSATFSRHDGFALSSVFDEIVYHKDFVEQIKEGWLSPIRFTTVKANLRLEQVQKSNSTGDLAAPSLSRAINTDEVNNVIVQAWKDKASNCKSTLVFAVDVAHVNKLADTFNAHGITAKTLTGTTPQNHRVELLDDFKQGKYPVLINCAILTEGADIPGIDCVLLARPTLSRNLFSQMIGRGLRLSPQTNKTECLILDLVNNTEHGLVCSPILFGLDPAISLEAKSVEELERMAADPANQPKMTLGKLNSKVAYADMSLSEMLDRQSPITTSLHRLSFNDWIPCSGGIYVLDLLGSGYIRVERPGSLIARYYRPLPGKQHAYAKPKIIYSEETATADFGRCIRSCDTFATSLPFIRDSWKSRGLLRSASWRQSDASEAQKTLLLKRLGEEMLNRMLNGSNTSDRTWETMSKGEAARLFNYLKHGGKGRLQKYDKVLVKEQKRSPRAPFSASLRRREIA